MNLAGLLGASKDLGARFNLVGLLPTAVLALFVLALLWSGAPGRSPDLDRVVAEAEDLGVWEGALLFLALVVVGLVLQPLQLSLVRLLEGYWGDSRLSRLLAAPGTAFHRRRRGRLAARQVHSAGRPSADELADMRLAEAALRRLYPPAVGVLPTKLGNVLRAAEHQAGSRYGLEATVAWTRLYPLLSKNVAALVDDERDQLDLTARFCVVFVVATVVSLGLLVSHGPWLLVPAATLVLAWLSYRAAVAAALAYGEGIATAFDLHRFDLLRALRLPLPPDRDCERRANARLSEFLVHGEALVDEKPVNFAYDHDEEKREAAAASRPPRGASRAEAQGPTELPARQQREAAS